MRVVIAEDDALLREGLSLLLKSEGFEVVAAVDNADDFLAVLDESDAAVLDVRMPPTFTNEGLQAAPEDRRRRPGFPVLVLSAYVEDRYAGDLLSEGAAGLGYLLKKRVGKVAEFTDTLRRVAARQTVMDPEVISQLMSRRGAGDAVSTLTPRERDVLGLMAEGLDNLSIAARLIVTETAVSKHIGNIFQKLQLSTMDRGHGRVLAVLAYLRS
jgi:DNA-binding NarL/FixJ family response regulator